MSATDEISQCLRDIEPEFVRTFAVTAAWEYERLFEELSSLRGITEDYKREQFNRRRGDCLVRALTVACDSHGVPYSFIKAANGQSKLLVKCGRVVLIQEPIACWSDAPQVADYKVELASAHGFVRQLEFDLGDQPGRVVDWDGSVLAVVLHGVSGTGFDRESKSLGSLMLAVPDARYSHWIVRLDLHAVAVDGVSLGTDATTDYAPETSQLDRVFVVLKAHSKKADK